MTDNERRRLSVMIDLVFFTALIAFEIGVGIGAWVQRYLMTR